MCPHSLVCVLIASLFLNSKDEWSNGVQTDRIMHFVPPADPTFSKTSTAITFYKILNVLIFEDIFTDHVCTAFGISTANQLQWTGTVYKYSSVKGLA